MNEVKAAAAENEEEKSSKFGWEGFERKNDAELQPKEEAKKTQSKPGEINFKKGRPPMFTKKKGIGIA